MNTRGFFDDDQIADDLTWREQDVLRLLAERLTNREIAARLHLAESTVKDYVGCILSKLYVKNRRQAVEKAKALGLLRGEAKTSHRQRTRLPAESTAFVGREEELAAVKTHLAGTRLLSLTGPGGIGKTRLALKAAEESESQYSEGCFFVSLAPILSAKKIVQRVAEVLDFPLATHEDPQYQLLRYLRNKQMLLVLDNFEHLLDGAELVGEILTAAPRVSILVTSREKLNLQGETIYTIGGMHHTGYVRQEDLEKLDAITLFLQSANRVCPGYAPSLAELKMIARICELVEGMPLAIELAASWLYMLSADEIVQELEKGLDILRADLRDIPERHHSIRAVFDHSWQLLDESEQKIFKHLSVFRAGFMREAALQVAGASLTQLAGLVNKSLLSRDPKTGRLTIHELLRQCAQERLEENEQVWVSAQEAHATYYAQFMNQHWRYLKGERQMQVLVEIEADIENIRAAWQYFLDHPNPTQLWNLIHGLWHVHWIRWWNHAGMQLFALAAETLVSESDREITALGALAKAYQGYFMAWLGFADEGYDLASQALQILEQSTHPRALVMAYDSLSINAYFLSRYTEEMAAIQKMVDVSIEIKDKWLLAFILYAPSIGALINGDYHQAEQLARDNLSLYEEIGDKIGSTMPLIVLGHVGFGRGEYELAKKHYLRCLNISEEVEFYYSIQTASKYLGKVALAMGNLEEAEKFLLKSLSITAEIGFVRDIVNLLNEFARLRAAKGDPELAVELLGLVLEHPSSDHTRWLEGRIRDSATSLLQDLKQILPPDVTRAALERGQGSQLEDVVARLFGSYV